MNDEVDGIDSSQPQRRANDRFDVNGEVSLRRGGHHNYRVHVFDLSETGCKVEIVDRPLVDEHVWVKFEGLEALPATVSWVTPSLAGLRFVRAIHPAVFEVLVKKLSG